MIGLLLTLYAINYPGIIFYDQLDQTRLFNVVYVQAAKPKTSLVKLRLAAEVCGVKVWVGDWCQSFGVNSRQLSLLLIINWMNYQIELEYRDRLATIKALPISSRTKILLLESLAGEMRYLMHSIKNNQLCKGKTFSEALSTSISECQSASYMYQKDIEELEQKILKLRLVKIQNNEEVETMEEELFQIEKIVKARMEYNEYLKKKIDTQMQNLQNNAHHRGEKEKSVLNKSLGTVAEMLNISKWWS